LMVLQLLWLHKYARIVSLNKYFIICDIILTLIPKFPSNFLDTTLYNCTGYVPMATMLAGLETG
jgi:hypothetical protein